MRWLTGGRRMVRLTRPDRCRSVPSATLGEQVFGRGARRVPRVLGRVLTLIGMQSKRWFVVVSIIGAVALGLLVGLAVVGGGAAGVSAVGVLAATGETPPARSADVPQADGGPVGVGPFSAETLVAQIGGAGALVTLLNPGSTARTVTLRDTNDTGVVGLPPSIRVEAADTRSFVVDVGADPVTFVAQCPGCRTVVFAVADGQRIIVVVLGAFAEGAGSLRGDVHVVNESNRRQSGALRTGAVVGLGLSVLRFDLAPAESMSVGLRLPALQTVDLNLTCAGCVPQVAQMSNGVDLEIVVR